MNANEALDALRQAVYPIVAAAIQTQPRPGWSSVRIGLSPLSITVALHTDADGEVGSFHGTPTTALADAVAEALNAFLVVLPATVVQQLGAIYARAPGSLWLLCDRAVTWVRVMLDPGGDADMLELGVLAAPEVRH